MLLTRRWRVWLILTATIALSLVLSRHVRAQQIYVQPEETAQQVYELLPAEFPQANTYVRRESGAVDDDNTLLSRFIAYHIYVKNRSPFFRFDWKLSLADYLGAHEAPSPNQYPSGNTLRENPLVSDRDLIRSFNRRERDELVQALVTVFNANRPRPAAAAGERTDDSEAVAEPELPTRPRSPRLPAAGAADLLR